MNPYYKGNEKESRNLIELATVVFKVSAPFQYKCVKSRYDDVILGAIYSKDFVMAYAKENINVYISKED